MSNSVTDIPEVEVSRPVIVACCCALLTYLTVFLLCMSARGALAQTESVRTLNTGWEFHALGSPKLPAAQAWHPAKVPGVVQTDLRSNGLIPDPFYGENEKQLQWVGLTDWVYRTTFLVSTEDLKHKHTDLVFDGLDTFAEVALNGTPLLKSDNMFRGWRIPVGSVLRPGKNELVITFRSPVTSMLPYVRSLENRQQTVSQIVPLAEEGLPTDPFTRKAAYQYGWDWGPRFVTEGIWRPVTLRSYDDLRIVDSHIEQNVLTKTTASLNLKLLVSSDIESDVSVEVSWKRLPGSSKGASEPVETIRVPATLFKGEHNLSIPFRINHPALWYPSGYGAQDRYSIQARILRDGHTMGERTIRTGLRTVELRREQDHWGKSFYFVVNGIPVFAKGASVIPFDSFPGATSPSRYREILTAARDVHMNMIREWGGGYYESDEFFDLCDELGLMVWQDFAFGGATVPNDPAYRENVREEATFQVDRLRNHPSLVLWCGNNEIETAWYHWPERVAYRNSLSRDELKSEVQGYLLLFNDVLKRVVERDGESVPYWPSTPSANYEAEPESESNGDMHYWQVWGNNKPVALYDTVTPRFMSEFGFQSMPEMKTLHAFAGDNDLAIGAPVLEAHQRTSQGNQRMMNYLLTRFPKPRDFASFVYLTQVNQADSIQREVEHLRSRMPQTMGALYWQLNDCWPGASWSSIDYFGRWKALHYAAARFYNDVLVSSYRHDGKVEVWLVSDRLRATDAILRTRVMEIGGKEISKSETKVSLASASSTMQASIKEADLLAGGDKGTTFAVFELIESGNSGKLLSRNVLYFAEPREMTLPNSQVSSTIDPEAGGYAITLKSPVLGRDVRLNLDWDQEHLSDNFFDLLPGEKKVVHLQTTEPLSKVRADLTITTLADAFLQDHKVVTPLEVGLK